MARAPAPVARVAPAAPWEPTPAPWWLRVWSQPLWAHAALALAILCGLAAWAGVGASFTSDEGASILQARAVEHGSWTVPDPLPGVDRTGAFFPIELSSNGPAGHAPLGKHLVYGGILALIGLLLGTPGMVGLSLLGTVMAALLAAALSRELRPGLERVTFWFVALGTPLFFDGFLVVGQAAAAALVAGSTLLGLRFLRGAPPRCLAGMAACAILACLLRTEAALWCIGLAAGALVAEPGTGHKLPSRRGGATALIALTSAVVARGADSTFTRLAVGTQTGVLGAPAGGHGLTDQLHAFFVSWLQAGADPYSTVGALMIVMLAVLAALAWLVRRGRFSTAGIMVVVVATTILWTWRVVGAPSTPVSGLMVACPFLWAGLWLVDRSVTRDLTGRLLVTGCVVFAGLVLVTQYSDGGGSQWGGRFFAVGLPLAAPLALEAMRRQGARLGRRTAAGVVAAAVLTTGAVAVGAFDTLRVSHRMGQGLAVGIEAAAQQAAAGDGSRPVVLTSDPLLPRLEWSIFDAVRWQLVPTPEMPQFGSSLLQAGISRFVLVTADPQMETGALAGTYRAVATRVVPGGSGWIVVTMAATGPLK